MLKRGRRRYVRARGHGPRWGRWLAALVFAGALAAGGYAVFRFVQTSPQFYVRMVRIEGLSALTEREVLDASGIASGDTIVGLDLEAMAGRVQALPYVHTAVATIVFPDTVIIRVTERTPFVTLMVRSHSYELDRGGVVLRAHGPEEMPPAPFITNVADLRVVEVGEVLGIPALESAMEVWEAFAGHGLERHVTVSEISAEHADYVRMYCDELDYEIRWGRMDARVQAKRLDALWVELGTQLDCAVYLDLRFGADIACK